MSGKPIRLLIVENDTEDYLIIQKMISRLKKNRFELDRVSTFDEALEKIGQNCHDVCLLDYRLDGHDGLEFLKEVKDRASSIPVIFLTSQADYEVDMEAMQLGAADFLNKNKIDEDLLERSIRYALERRKADENRIRLAAIVESSNDAIYTLTPKGIILSWNPGAERIYGYSPEEIGGRDAALLIPEGRLNDFPTLLKTVQQGHPLGNFTALHRTKAGSEILLSICLSPIPDTSGQVNRISVIARDITASERAKAVQDMLQSERDQLLGQLQVQMETMPIACVLTDQDFNFTYWNPAAEKMFGYVFMEAEGKPFSMILTSEAGREGGKTWLQTLEGGDSPAVFTREAKRKDGRTLFCEWHLTGLRDREGNLQGLMAMIVDVTERKKSEEILAQNEERFRRIFQDSPIGMALVAGDSKIMMANPRLCRFLGYGAEDLEGRSFDWITHPDDLKKDMDQFRQLAEGRVQSYDMNKRYLHKDGRVLWGHLTVTLIRDRAGKPLYGLGMITDITERRKAEEVQSQLAAILQQTSDAVVGIDLDGNIFSWNRGAETLFGYELNEVIGHPVTLLSPEDHRHEEEELREIVKNGENISNFETVRLKKGGASIDVSITLSPIKDSRGKTIGVSAIHRDITEKKHAEESLRMHEEQMRQVDKMNAIGRLAGGVAHDFNNLLSVIGGNAEFLAGSLEKESTHQEEIQEIQKAVHRGADLTKQLLVFSRKQVSKPQAVNLNDISSEMSKMLKRLLDAHVELAIIQEKNLKPILADSGQIQQALMNLALNARDAMPKGGNLLIETKNVNAEDLGLENKPGLRPGDYVRLSVTDTGLGMSPETQKHIFEPFFTTKAEKGTGLGLANVYAIVTQWNGHIFLHSTPGMGTTFTLYFPVLSLVETPQPKSRPAVAPTQGSETILVAEDEESVRKILVRTLKNYGYEVIEAKNGIDAVQKAWDFKKTIHLLLTDTVMPKMNGKELADEIHKNRPETKVLFITGYPQEILSQQGILDSGIRLLQKPFEQETLVAKIREILDEK